MKLSLRPLRMNLRQLLPKINLSYGVGPRFYVLLFAFRLFLKKIVFYESLDSTLVFISIIRNK